QDARRHADLRRWGDALDDPQGSGGLHGLPLALRVLVMEGPRRLHHGAARRSAQFLHSEDVAGYRPWRFDREQPDVRRPWSLSLQAGSVLFEQFYTDGEGTGGPDSHRRLRRTGDVPPTGCRALG